MLALALMLFSWPMRRYFPPQTPLHTETFLLLRLAFVRGIVRPSNCLVGSTKTTKDGTLWLKQYVCRWRCFTSARHDTHINAIWFSRVAIISKNCAHWIISDLAIWMAGHISVPLYTNLTADSVNQVLRHSETALVFVGKLDDWPAMAPGVPQDVPTIGRS